MKEDSLAELAKKLNISKSTLSKAIRHCSGVDSATRQLVLDSLPKDGTASRKNCSVYTILPDLPQYFWKELLRGLMNSEMQRTVKVKNNIYTRCLDEATVLDYLREAEEMNVKVLIIAAYLTPEVRKYLERLVDRCLVILLTEYGELTNSFFIGADGYRDGYSMGKAYLAHYTDKRLVYFDVLNNNNAEKRLSGFTDAVREEAPSVMDNAIRIQIDNHIFCDLKIISSRLASILSESISTPSDYCLYSPVGMAQQLPVAFRKVCHGDSVVCMCHDCPEENGIPHENFHICCNQDLYAQGSASAEAALEYLTKNLCPPTKQLYIPSRIMKQQ